nr:DUF1905 domain-containing protein [Paenibacillus harenae]
MHLSKKTATGIQVPDEVVESLGAGKKPAVKITIGDYSYRSTVASMGGVFIIPVSAEHRSGAGVSAGGEVDVDIELCGMWYGSSLMGKSTFNSTSTRSTLDLVGISPANLIRFPSLSG